MTERELRARLRLAVDDLEPAAAALPLLRVAVPRRRARRRNAWTGAAVVTLAAAVALPALHGVDPLFDLSGGATAGAAGAPGSAHPTHPPTGSATRSAPAQPPAAADPSTAAAPTASGTAGPSGTPTPGATGAVPACLPAALGKADARIDPADAAGRVYGWFHVANTSAQSCRIDRVGTVDAVAAPGAGSGTVRVLAHAAGDPADGLPDPAGLPREVVLAPGAAYVVRFGWVPGRACDTATAAPSTAGQTVAQADTSAAAVAPAGSAAPGASPGPSTDPTAAPTATTGPDNALTLSYALATGTPALATAQLKGACDGTVYQSTPEPAPTPTPAPPTPTPS
ncbi:hypothetical protein ACGFX4_27205 [Kitasatospora sp. NPDC048365]|uniref:hypothetical protein n=1 Tax=Kitasatospora sp. NPDC048365 TaxID=3364050 RepID=UPI0037206D05